MKNFKKLVAMALVLSAGCCGMQAASMGSSGGGSGAGSRAGAGVASSEAGDLASIKMTLNALYTKLKSSTFNFDTLFDKYQMAMYRSAIISGDESTPNSKAALRLMGGGADSESAIAEMVRRSYSEAYSACFPPRVNGLKDDSAAQQKLQDVHMKIGEYYANILQFNAAIVTYNLKFPDTKFVSDEDIVAFVAYANDLFKDATTAVGTVAGAVHGGGSGGAGVGAAHGGGSGSGGSTTDE